MSSGTSIGIMAAKMRPWYVSMMMGMSPCVLQQVAKTGAANGLDWQLMAEAEKADIPVVALEPWDTVLTMFGGLTPQVADNISRQLMTRDPTQVQNILAQVRRIEQAQISADRKAVALRQLLTNFAAGVEGREAGRPASAMPALQYR